MRVRRLIPAICLATASLIASAAEPSNCNGALDLVKSHSTLPNLRLERCDAADPGGLLQAIVVSTKGKPSREYGIHMYSLQIYRGSGSHWIKVLDIGRQITNPFGYIGADYIDPDQASDHWIVVTNNNSKASGVELAVYFTAPDGSVDVEGLPIDIAWNPKLLRFQEWADDDNSGFKAEKPHLSVVHIQH